MIVTKLVLWPSQLLSVALGCRHYQFLHAIFALMIKLYVSVAVGLRFCSNLGTQHICPCGVLVFCHGTHRQSCDRSAEICKTLLLKLYRPSIERDGVAPMKEPVGILRAEGKRSDELTLVSWQAGRNAVWNVTVTDTMAITYLPLTFVPMDSVAEIAALRQNENEKNHLSPMV